jgi:hypothetical protein
LISPRDIVSVNEVTDTENYLCQYDVKHIVIMTLPMKTITLVLMVSTYSSSYWTGWNTSWLSKLPLLYICIHYIVTVSSTNRNCIDGGMVSMFTSSVVDRGFEHLSVQTKDYKIGICCFTAKHAALKRKSKDWLAWNQDNMSEWGNISIRWLLLNPLSMFV